MLTLKLRQRFWKLFDCWAKAESPRTNHRPTFQPRLEVLEDRLVPTTWNVAGLGDAGQGMTNEGDLRYCMNNARSGDTILFGVGGTIQLTSQLPTITQNITINGNGESIFISGNDLYGVFEVAEGVNAEIDGVTIENGNVSGDGGGLYNAGTVTLKNDEFLNNQAGDKGGGIFIPSGGKTTMEGSSVNNNKTTNGDGAGVYNNGTFTGQHCDIVNNTAGGNGGGIYNMRGSVYLEGESVVQDNSASSGGGIYENSGTVTVAGTFASAAVQHNTASSSGGGIYVAGGTLTLSTASVSNNKVTNGFGGGIYVGGGKVAMTSGSIANNKAYGFDGGGIYVSKGKLTLDDVNVKFNWAAGDGGGLAIGSGSATIAGGFTQENTAGNLGGGIYNAEGTLTLKGGVAVNDNGEVSEGGGLYLGNLSTTTFTSCEVSGNSTTGSKQTTGWGVYVQGSATVNGLPAGLTDDDDPKSEPVSGN